MTRFRIALAAALLAAPFAAAGQAPATPAAPATPRAAAPPLWQVDWGPYFCSLIRLPGEGRPYAAAFLTVPGSDSTQLLLIPQQGMNLPASVTALVLQPGGRRFPVVGRIEPRGDVQALSLGGLPYEFRGMLEGATELQVIAGVALRLRIPVDRARAAVAEHRRCTAGIAREWQLDEAALAALQRRPEGLDNMGFRSDDYPRAALRAATQGRVIARVTVNAAGRATDCAVVATSGNAEIDASTCRGMLTRAHFRPALDAAGQPVPIAAVFTVTWRIPGAYRRP
jgi:TonB family protein